MMTKSLNQPQTKDDFHKTTWFERAKYVHHLLYNIKLIIYILTPTIPKKNGGRKKLYTLLKKS